MCPLMTILSFGATGQKWTASKIIWPRQQQQQQQRQQQQLQQVQQEEIGIQTSLEINF